MPVKTKGRNVKRRNVARPRRVNARKRKNPVRVAATVTGKGTGWIKAKAVRVVTKGGVSRVEVKR